MAGSGDRLHTSWVTVTTRLLPACRVFACARSCWVEGGGRRRKREQAWQMVQAGRWCISVGSSADAGVEFHAEREREREREANSRPALPQMQRQARRWCLVPRRVAGEVAGFFFCFYFGLKKKGSKSCLFLADRILPSCPRKDFFLKVESMGSVQISKRDQFSTSAREENQIWHLKPNHNRSRPSFGPSQISTVKGAWKRADWAFNVTQTAVSPIADVFEMPIQVAMETEVGWGLTNIWSVFRGEEMRKHLSSTDICCLATSVDWSCCWLVCWV